MTVTFDDLPVDVLEKVVGKSSLFDCLTLRKVCKDLRNLVDSSEINCDSIGFKFTSCSCLLTFKDLTLKYIGTREGGCTVTSFKRPFSGMKTYRDDRNWKQVILANTSTFFKNPKLMIDRLSLCVETTATAAAFFEFLKSLKSPLTIRSIESSDIECLHSIVPLLKQEKLEEIIYKKVNFDAAQFNEIATNDTAAILKNPRLKIPIMTFGNYSDESAAKFAETLKSISSEIKFESMYIFEDQEKWIVPALRSLDPDNVKEMVVNCVKFTLDQFNEFAGKEQWKKVTRLIGCSFPRVIRLEQFVDFEEFQFKEFKTTDESLVTVRDIILKSPHFQKCRLVDKSSEISKREMYEKLDRIFGQDSSYDSQTRRFTIRDSRDYFQLRLNDFRKTTGKIYLSIRRTSEI